ncbi:MAG: glycosyltransferase family 2 protein, partial [candidate division WOR-3 bacterium]
MPSASVSVIIVSYNTRRLLEKCLVSVQAALEATTDEIIVVDNNSSDGSAEMVERDFPCVRLIRSPVNLGYGKANNLAARSATGEYCLFLNPDTIVSPDLPSTLLDYACGHPLAGAIGCQVVMGTQG